MKVFRLSNKIFELGLTVQEMAVYAYMSSLPSEYPMLDDAAAVKVKQSTIAQKCGIKAVQTVAKVIALLSEKELVEPLKREIKANKHKGTYVYTVKKLPTEDSFFFVDRHVFGRLIPRQMMIYLFLCKSYSNKLKDSWNSYNDISNQTGMKRETVIKTISELEVMKLIAKSKRKSKWNNRVYVDNHYQIIFFVRGKISKVCKKIARLHCKYSRTEKLLNNSHKLNSYNSTYLKNCQVVFEKFSIEGSFFSGRGSP